ncbi:MAG: HTH-type transcriptional regulator, sugar sensing transcriptional regulator [Candidatus Diapherotrites archaeon]|nr:HTH-type transcriptional regulator, sugar sensing transcriptional regulator [Candidatus Diapherotrites archaeon]MDN5366750.1 HTH-type transcriptional regulator, sugar sensing transcriptional regulator [Candidatus Diapherotrites archaeon]
MGMDAKQKLVSLLRSIGLNQYEAQAYASLLLFGGATAGELSNRAEVPRPRVYDIIGRLEKKGFVVVEPGRPVKYRAVPPKQAIQAYLKLKEEEFKKEYERILSIAEQLEREHGPKMKKETEKGIWVLNTDNVLRTSIQNIISSAQESVIITLTPEFFGEYGNTILPAIQQAASRGVSVTVLAPKSMKGTFAVAGDVEVVESESELPPSILVDNRTAVIAMPNDNKAVLVDHPEFARSLRNMMSPHIEYI